MTVCEMRCWLVWCGLLYEERLGRNYIGNEGGIAALAPVLRELTALHTLEYVCG